MFRKRSSIFLFLLLPVLISFVINISSKNACTNYFDYLKINFGGDCFFNPDVVLPVPDLIEKYTGHVQTYNITTEDGYILTMFRIPRTNPKGVILLQPPISAGSIAWLSDGANSLGFSLWRKGYEVWLSNHRGASYSRKHVNLLDADPTFWNFGFHEIAVYDLEAQFNVIFEETKSKIIFIGYSMGATEALIYASLNPEKTENFIDSLILVAPLTVLKHLSSNFKYILYPMLFLKDIFKMGEFLTFEVVRWLAQPVTIVPYIVDIMTPFSMGATPNEMDPALFPYVFAHHGRGISHKMIYHYGQIFLNNNNFSMYDYGTEHNRLKYGSDRPPDYPLQNVKKPVYVIYGDKDAVATPADINILCTDLLPKGTVRGTFAMPNHNHIDFMFSRYRKNKTYQALFTILDNIEMNK
ncbi:lipase 1-like [Zophobas morio]|uniref:lipase 1-like n=1 Tax=Zophobas morio TaxID=2755281 RepID=UPI00308384E7